MNDSFPGTWRRPSWLRGRGGSVPRASGGVYSGRRNGGKANPRARRAWDRRSACRGEGGAPVPSPCLRGQQGASLPKKNEGLWQRRSGLNPHGVTATEVAACRVLGVDIAPGTTLKPFSSYFIFR